MSLRRVIFWLHLTAGAVAGLVVLIMSVTGVLLTYEKQMLAWADRRAARAALPREASARTPRGSLDPYTGPAAMDLEALLANVRKAGGSLPASITVRADARDPVSVTMPTRETLLVDAHSGAILGPQPVELRNFFRRVTEWHRWLGALPEGRTRARAITGACNLAFLFLVGSGLYLWFPRKKTWPGFRKILWFRGSLRGKARDFNWHNVAGFWCCVPLLFVVASAVVMSYPWANDLLYRAAGSQPPAQGKGRGGRAEARPSKTGPRNGGAFDRTPRPEGNLAGLNALLARAAAEAPAWQSITLRLPASDRQPVTVSLDTGNGGQPQKRATLTLDRQTGAVIARDGWTSQDAGRRARSWIRFVHTGEYYGLAGQTIAGIASLGAALLVWTGISLAVRRFRNWLWRRPGAPALEPAIHAEYGEDRAGQRDARASPVRR